MKIKRDIRDKKFNFLFFSFLYDDHKDFFEYNLILFFKYLSRNLSEIIDIIEIYKYLFLIFSHLILFIFKLILFEDVSKKSLY